MKDFILLNKSIFFPKKGILAIGDLHIGYERMLKTSGFEFPINQIKETKKELEKIFEEIRSKKFKLKKIVLLGDMKHFFIFDKGEKYDVYDLISFLSEKIGEKNLVIIKGNHEKFSLTKLKGRDYFITGEIAFTHGDKLFPEILNKKIKTIVLGHLHPAVIIHDQKSHKKEKYKCFLIGKWKGKTCIILPSFLQVTIGTEIIKEYKDKKNWAFIPKKSLLKFKALVIGEENKIYNFGVLKNLRT